MSAPRDPKELRLELARKVEELEQLVGELERLPFSYRANLGIYGIKLTVLTRRIFHASRDPLSRWEREVES